MNKLILAITILFSNLIPMEQEMTMPNYQSFITAHRGSSAVAPENTLSAIRQAIEDGAGFAEIDVQQTADGVIVLMHDKNMKRTTGMDKNVSDAFYYEVAQADAGSWFSSLYQGEAVPTLAQVMDEAKGKLRLNIELKPYGSKQLAPAIVKLLEEKQWIEGCFVSSFDAQAIRDIKRLNSRIKTGIVVSSEPAELEQLFKNNDYEIISAASFLVDDSFMNLARRYNKEVHVWTVNKEEEMVHLLKMGVASIITNYPDRLNKVIQNQISATQTKPLWKTLFKK